MWEKKISYLKDNRIWIIIATAVIGIAYLPFMNDFLLWGHDSGFHLGRIEGLAMCLKSGDLLGRINPVNGYGYASGIMYPQLFLYIPAILHILGVSLMDSYKLFIFFINVITFVNTYVAVKNILRKDDKCVPVLASSFYTLGLYRLVNLYLRGAVGEALGMAFLPIIMWGMYELFFGEERKWWIAVIGWTCILQSHFLSLEMALGFSALVFAFGIKKICCKKRLIAITKAVVLICLLNAFFIIPFLQYFVTCDFWGFHMSTEIGYTAVYFSQMFSTFVNNAGRLKILGNTAGEMPSTIGAISLLTIIVYFLLRDKEEKKIKRIGDIFLFLACICMFAASDMCPWGVLYRFPLLNKIASSIQYLFRFLSFASLFLTIVFAINVDKLKKNVKETWLILGVVLLIIQNCWYYIDSTVQTEDIVAEDEVESKVYIDEMYLYKEFSILKELYSRGNEIEIVSGNTSANILEKSKKGSTLVLEISDCTESVDIEVPIYYYPSYRAELNGHKLNIEQGSYGMIRINNISEDGILKISFPEQPLWIVADLVSAVTVMICIVIIIMNIAQKKKVLE